MENATLTDVALAPFGRLLYLHRGRRPPDHFVTMPRDYRALLRREGLAVRDGPAVGSTTQPHDDSKPLVDEADALFMFGACSAFVTYLIEKAKNAKD